MAQELWRKAQLSGTEGLDQMEGEGEGVGGGIEEWMEKTQETINSLRSGETIESIVYWASSNCCLFTLVILHVISYMNLLPKLQVFQSSSC